MVALHAAFCIALLTAFLPPVQPKCSTSKEHEHVSLSSLQQPCLVKHAEPVSHLLYVVCLGLRHLLISVAYTPALWTPALQTTAVWNASCSLYTIPPFLPHAFAF